MEEKIMKSILGICDDKVIYRNKDVNLFETGLIDSMGFIELLVAIEDDFDIEIDPSEINKDEMSTPNQLIEFVRSRING